MVKIIIIKLFLVIFALLTVCGVHVFASDLNYERVAMEAKKKVHIAKHMQLSGQQDRDFWAVYSNYERDMDDIYRRKFDLVVKFRRANDANQMTDNLAAKMLDDFFSIENDKLRIKQSYISEFRKVLPNKKVTLFYQIDNKLDAIVNHEIAIKIKLLQ